MNNYNQLPENLPVPEDDGAAAHLPGLRLPAISLPSTQGTEEVHLNALKGRLVIYCYPMTGKPGLPLPDGWDQIPGARGCTPQSCAYRDHYQQITALGAAVFGLSSQTSDYQREMAERLHLPFGVLSDTGFALQAALNLPTFQSAGVKLYKRLTLVAQDGLIKAVHYPIFPSDADAAWVMDYLRSAHPV